MRPTHEGLKLSAIFFAVLYRSHPLKRPYNFYGDRPRGTPSSGALNARGVANDSDGGPIEGYNLINGTRYGFGYN